MEIYYYILILFIAVAFYLDVRYQKIPNWLSVSGVVVGLVYHTYLNGFQGFKFSFLGMIVGTVILLLLYMFKGVGGGDVKLFSGIGAITGVHFTLYGMMYSIVFAGIIGVIILLFRREFTKRIIGAILNIFNSLFSRNMQELDTYKRKEAVRFPFMYAVLPGMLMTIYYFL